LRIAILGLRGIPSSYSGFETFVQELAPRLVASGHEVTVYCRRRLFSERPEVFKGVDLVYLPSVEHKMLSTVTHSIVSMFSACRSQFDVLLVLNAINGWLGILSRLSGIPAAINVDGMEWNRPKWNRVAKRAFWLSARLGTRFFDAVVTDADAMGAIYEEQFGVQCRVIPYGGDSTSGNLDASEVSAALGGLGLAQGDYYLVVARRVPDNNGDLIVDGFVRSVTSRKLVVVGGANYRGNRRETEFFLRMKNAADDRVIFLGQVHDQALLESLWSGAYAYLHGHGFGGTNPSLLRAMNQRCCVLALDTVFSREVLANGHAGILFPPDPESLSRHIDSIDARPSLVSQYGELAARRVADAYSWDYVTRSYEGLLASLTGK
jgi:glycosyltransferase involved in cell wall biosynthesis